MVKFDTPLMLLYPMDSPINRQTLPFEGDQEYKYFTKRENRSDWIGDIQWARKHYHEVFTIWNDVEQYMVKNGVTYYKR